jgi:predicted neuraminidase/peroxiredoxin
MICVRRLFLAALLLGMACRAVPGAGLGDAAGPVSLVDAEGAKVVVNHYDDRLGTVFFFLSARSEAVAKTIAAVDRLYNKHRRLGVLYVGICSNSVESADELRDFAQKRGLRFAVYRDPAAQIARQWGIQTVPAAVLVDRGGKIAHRGGLESEGQQLALDAAIVNGNAQQHDRASVQPTPIDEPGPKRTLPDLYGAPAFASELVFERIPGTVAFHCSTITQTPRGDLLCLWYGGSYESADDQTLFLARRPKGSRIWQPPQPILRNAEHPPGNGVIFVDGHQHVWIVWCRMETPRPRQRGTGWENCKLMYRVSRDDGRTWSADREFPGVDTLRAVPRNPPLRLSNGDLMLAVEAYTRDQGGSAFLIGANGGARWTLGGFVTGGSQPALVQRHDGSLFALMREKPRLTQTTSHDGGRTWTKVVPSAIPNPDAGITMTRLSNGHLILVFNDSETKRTPLSVARSVDEGSTWEAPMNLESNLGEYSYPCVIQTTDGRIHVSYTFRRYAIKHVEFNEDWIVHTERPD